METKTIKPGAKGYVESLAEMDFPGFKEILEAGEEFTGRIPIKSNDITKSWAKWEKPKAGLCYMNAQKFAIHHPEAKYYEGYWDGAGIAIHHGWVVMDGKVYDFTAEACARKIKRELKREPKGFKAEAETYFGVHIPTDFIHEKILETKMWSDLLRPFLFPRKKEG